MKDRRPIRKASDALRTSLAGLLAFAALLAGLSGCGYGNRFIFSSSEELIAWPDQYGLAYREVTFPAADGIELHGWLVPGLPEKPLVLFFHGNAANISHRVENLLSLNAMGLSVFIFDYRGFGHSKGTPHDETDLYRDARGALSFVRSTGRPPSQIIYYGRSMGAAVALQLALETPPARLVLECPFTSLRDIALHATPILYATLGWWGIDNQFRNIDKISRITSPLLLIHGDRDPVVPMEMSKKLFARAPHPKRLLIVPGAGHSNSFQVGAESYEQAWRDLIASDPPHEARLTDD